MNPEEKEETFGRGMDGRMKPWSVVSHSTVYWFCGLVATVAEWSVLSIEFMNTETLILA